MTLLTRRRITQLTTFYKRPKKDTANILTIKTTGIGLQGKSALAMEKGCKNWGETP